MTSKELRIGNYYKCYCSTEGSEGFFTIKLTEQILKDYLNGDSDYEYFEPIPLTEDWIIKFGFKYQSLNNTLLLNGFLITWDYRNNFAYIKCFDSVISVTHVHQLQNIYFDLVCQELEIKEI